MEKRQRLDVVEARVQDARAFIAQLKSVYGGLPEDFLWDTSKFQNLISPRMGFTAENLSDEYTYIGRARAKDLYELLAKLCPGNVVLIQGAKGSGKTTAMSSIVGFMLAKELKRVVYFTAGEFGHFPDGVLRDALLVATGGDEHVAGLSTMSELSEWCEAQRIGEDRLLFVVDDWDKFENFPQAESQLTCIVRYHILVKLSSANSRDRHMTDASDKPLPSFDFDGPYTDKELKTWTAQSKLPPSRLETLDCLTGGMPQLLRFYEEAGGNAKLFREMIEEKYTRKLYEKLVALQTTPGELAALVQLVTTGVRGTYLKLLVDMTFFYKDKNRLLPLSPFLRSKIEYYIMEQQAQLAFTLQLKDIQRWSDAVQMDCVAKGRNSSRVGWNVEGLVIAVMRYQGKLWHGLAFQHVKTYESGCRAALLESLTDEELMQGVLVVPVAFNERALDVIYLRRMPDGNVLKVKAVQITVSRWKHKRRKRPHLVWQQKVLPRWLAEGWVVEHQFIYVLPDTLSKEELGQLEWDLQKYIELCRAAPPPTSTGDDNEEDDEEDECFSGTAVYDDEIANLDKVRSEELLFKKFGDVHPCLSKFDRKLRLGEPSKLEKKSAKQCSGQVVENGTSRQCKRWCLTDEMVWFCSMAHAPAH